MMMRDGMLTDHDLQFVAKKVFKKYGKPDDPNVESLAYSIVRWTGANLKESIKALKQARENTKNDYI